MDLAVTNGNIEGTWRATGTVSAILVNRGIDFSLYDVQEPQDYWQGKYLGRGMGG